MTVQIDLAKRLREIGRERYHHKHPFHRLLHAGQLSKKQVQAWALNRYCYQAAIPIKDAIILSRLEDSALRRIWRLRIEDHDGIGDKPGGIERWLKLIDDLGLSRREVISFKYALPAVQFAVNAYITFVRERSLLEAVASSLTEMFSPDIISERLSGMLANYDFVDEESLSYFSPRLKQAPRDADFALAYVLEHATDAESQERVVQALLFKCDMLWAQLDALYFAYVEPAKPPPSAFAI